MVAPTRREWEESVIAAYDAEPCPHCGLNHRAYDIDDWGVVGIMCPQNERYYAIGSERVPATFTPEPDIGDDLPF